MLVNELRTEAHTCVSVMHLRTRIQMFLLNHQCMHTCVHVLRWQLCKL